VNQIPVVHFLYLSAILFGIGLFGVLARKNAISVLMGIELMLNAVNINFLAFAKFWGQGSLTGPVFVVFIITIAAAEAAVALAIVISIYRQLKSANVDEAHYLKG
jgi:NADH:ubiquinone oxidoreductase subunit K